MKAWFKKWFGAAETNQLNPVTYFTHIPKTAGTSFIVLLDRFFSVNEVFPCQLWREAKTIDKESNQKYSLYRGHFGGGGVSFLTDRPIEYFTILRDPTTLSLSTYHFVQREQNTKVHDLVKQDSMSFTDFLRHPMTTSLVQNRMVRNLSFDFKADPAAQEVFLAAETIEYLQSIIQSSTAALTDEQRLNRAYKFIENSTWFGLLERFEESLQLLSFIKHWPPIRQTQKLNTYQAKTQLSTDERQRLLEINQQDYQLYQFADQKFDERIKYMRQQLENIRTSATQEIDDLLDLNYQRHHSARHNQPDDISFCFQFDSALLGDQWHRREIMQPENDFFRWTGPGSCASIDFWVHPCDYEISMRIINAISVEVLERLQIKINGHHITWCSDGEGIVRVLTMRCPHGLILDNNLLRIEIICPTMNTHQQAFESNDERVVGVAVHWIQFNHVK